MPDPHRIARELNDLLSGPLYSSLFQHYNQFRDEKREPKPRTAASLSADKAAWIAANNPFVDPVFVEEMRGGDLQLYRVYDGKPVKTGGAGTLGQSWFERSVLESIWSATQRWQKDAREQVLMDFLRSANFIHPQWNGMTEIACMQVPEGARVVVIRGRGNWKAMRSKPGKPLNPDMRNPKDVEEMHGSMALPGTYQCIVPLYSDMWVRNVPKDSAAWPLLA